MNTYDVIIIGSGPIGMACAIEAKREKLDYLVIEKGTLVNSLYNYPLYMTFFSTSERLEIGEVPFTSISFKPGRQDVLEYYRRIRQYFDLNIHLYEEALDIELFDEFKLVTTNKSKYYSKNIIISTGFYLLRYSGLPEYSGRKPAESEPLLQRSASIFRAESGDCGCK